ncbi:MAG: hypothetical protein LBM62_02070, partial [Mediterranea sp.]|nr:hypothetical protein [Mediterranea sp.]
MHQKIIKISYFRMLDLALRASGRYPSVTPTARHLPSCFRHWDTQKSSFGFRAYQVIQRFLFLCHSAPHNLSLFRD